MTARRNLSRHLAISNSGGPTVKNQWIKDATSSIMNWYDLLFLAVFLVVWLLLVTKVLPRFGVGG